MTACHRYFAVGVVGGDHCFGYVWDRSHHGKLAEQGVFWSNGIAPPQKVVKNNVLCFIMAKGDFQEQGMNSMYEWGHKCNKTLFMTLSSSSFTNATLKRNYTVLMDAFPDTQVVPLDFFNETEDTHDNVGHKAW